MRQAITVMKIPSCLGKRSCSSNTAPAPDNITLVTPNNTSNNNVFTTFPNTSPNKYLLNSCAENAPICEESNIIFVPSQIKKSTYTYTNCSIKAIHCKNSTISRPVANPAPTTVPI